MAKGILADLLIKLGLDSKELDSGLDNAKSKTTAFADGIKKLGAMMVAAFSVAAITAFVKSAIAGAKEQIRVENELGAAIRANGKDVDSNLNAYKAFASQLQRNSTVGDETTLSLIRLAETMQSKAPMEAAQNAVALSKAFVVDLNTATKMAVLAQSGLYSMLERYTPSLRNANGETEKAAEYNKIIASGLTMVADELNTVEGRIIQNSNAWGDFKENLGMAILSSDWLTNALSELDKSLTIINSNLSFWQKINPFESQEKTYQKALASIEAQEEAAKKGAKQQAEFNNLIGEVVVSAEEYNKRVKEAFENWDKNNEKLAKHSELLESIDDTFASYEKKIKGFKGIDLSPTVVDSSGINESISMFPLSDESTEDLGFNTEAFLQYKENFRAFVEDMKMSAVDFSINVVDEIGNAFGELAASGEFPDDFGKNILGIIGSFISELGKMLIGLGVASEAFQKLLASGFLAGGIPLIIAGAALVLLGGAISGFAKSSSGTGSSSSGVTTSAYTQSSYNSQSASSENNTVEFVIKGNTLVGVLANQSRKNGLIG